MIGRRWDREFCEIWLKVADLIQEQTCHTTTFFGCGGIEGLSAIPEYRSFNPSFVPGVSGVSATSCSLMLCICYHLRKEPI